VEADYSKKISQHCLTKVGKVESKRRMVLKTQGNKVITNVLCSSEANERDSVAGIKKTRREEENTRSGQRVKIYPTTSAQ
jgi:hypothetical protein